MPFTQEAKQALGAKLDASHVKKRAQAGRQLSYIEGWFAISEANRIFGFDGWTRETVELKQVAEPSQNEKGNWVVGYMARVRITVGDVVRDGCGFGSGIDKDLGRAHESALKEAETDAMKRALMTFGNPFGLALYDKEQANVENGNGKHEPEPDAKAHFLQRTREQIAAFGDRDALLTWWNSKEQKDARSFAGINKTELELLMSLVTARRDELTPKKKDAA
jgi:DNA repair and recombination protein RAD52